jgi:tyrosyl-tRNA synthetase
MPNFIEELTWRGMVHDVMPGTEEQLNKEITAGYVGFDPTAASLHIGNLATIMLLVHLQRAGHKPVALVGGATGMIGDPSFKAAERAFLSEEVLLHNQEGIRRQLAQFLDFSGGPQAAELVNNYDWFKNIGFLQFMREAGKHLTVNYMMAKDSVKKRLETGGLSFTEFSYQLLQGYDFYHLYKTKGVRLQMGGSDQWGNITAGTELIRRKEGGEAFALTTPLVTKADGTKFGKSESGNVWLDPAMTSPYKFYQFWRNVADSEIGRLLRVFTLFDQARIQALEGDNPNNAKMALAEEITTRVHGADATGKAIQASSLLFGKGTLDALQNTDEQTLLEVCEGVPQIRISRDALSGARDVTELLSVTTDAQIFPSKGEARKMIQGGGVSINKTKVEKPEQPVDFALLQEKYLLVQKGKKNYFLMKVE